MYVCVCMGGFHVGMIGIVKSLLTIPKNSRKGLTMMLTHQILSSKKEIILHANIGIELPCFET